MGGKRRREWGKEGTGTVCMSRKYVGKVKILPVNPGRCVVIVCEQEWDQTFTKRVCPELPPV